MEVYNKSTKLTIVQRVDRMYHELQETMTEMRPRMKYRDAGVWSVSTFTGNNSWHCSPSYSRLKEYQLHYYSDNKCFPKWQILNKKLNKNCYHTYNEFIYFMFSLLYQCIEYMKSSTLKYLIFIVISCFRADK